MPAGRPRPPGRLPAGQAKVLGSLGQEKVALYEGKVEIPVRLSLAPDGPARHEDELKLKLNYQACDDRVCLAPASLAIPLEVTVGTPATPRRASHESKIPRSSARPTTAGE